MIKKPHVVHFAVQGALTLNAVVTLGMHAVSPEAEAVAFCLTAVMAIWANDIEKKIRHPKLA
jgi:hypothetical protein